MLGRLSDPMPRYAATVALLTVGATVAGFYMGLRAADRRTTLRWETYRRRSREEVCECGTVLPKNATPEERERHRFSNRHRRNMQQLEHASEVVVCEEVGEYRAAAVQLVKPTDWVLEVGSHVGGTTKVLAGLTSKLIGVDQQPDLVAQARTKMPNVRFEILDAFDAHKVLALSRELAPEKFAKVFIDISGSRDIATVVRLMDQFENTLRPDVMVVKSQALKRLLMRSQLWIHHESQLGSES